MKEILDSTDCEHWIDAISSLNDDQLAEFLVAVMGTRSLRAVRRRLSLAGALAVILDFGVHSGEMQRMYEEIYGRKV